VVVHIPQPKIAEKPVRHLIKLGEKKDRSVNSLVVEAILEYVKREERKDCSTELAPAFPSR